MSAFSRRRLTTLPAAALCLAALAGCATSSTAPSLFVLDAGKAPAAKHTPRPGAPTLAIKPVATAAYLRHGGIVYQTKPHRLVIADHNRWASPLSDQLSDGLYAALVRRLPDVKIVRNGGSGKARYILKTRVDQFAGRYDGKAVIRGQWTLADREGKTLAGRAFSEHVALKSDGYPALVKSLSKGWQRVTRTMASALKHALRRHGGS
jgi:uncharacterized lipoprotein YmbA